MSYCINDLNEEIILKSLENDAEKEQMLMLFNLIMKNVYYYEDGRLNDKLVECVDREYVKKFNEKGIDSIEKLKQSEEYGFLKSLMNDNTQSLADKYLDLVMLRAYSRIEYNAYLRGFKTSNVNVCIDVIFSELLSLIALEKNDFDIIKYLDGGYAEDKNIMKLDIVKRGIILALELSIDNTEVLDKLKGIVYDTEGITAINHAIIQGALWSENNTAHQCIVDLLKAAKTSEGLRQSIVEYIDLASLEVYKKFLQIIVDDNLIRFSSVKRFLLVALGCDYQVTVKDIQKFDLLLKAVYDCVVLGERDKYLASDSEIDYYVALYSMAILEKDDLIKYALNNYKNLANHQRFVLVIFMSQYGLLDIGEVIEILKSGEVEEKLFMSFALKVDKIMKESYTKDEEKQIIEFFDEMLTKYPKASRARVLLTSKDGYIPYYDNYIGDLMLKCANDLDEDKYYDMAYKYVQYFSPNRNYDAKTKKYDSRNIFVEIHTPFVREQLINLLSVYKDDKYEVDIKVAAERIKDLNMTLTKDEYLKVAALLSTKKEEKRVYLIKVLETADFEIISEICRKFIKLKNEQKKNSAVDLFLTQSEKYGDTDEYKEILAIIKKADLEESVKELLPKTNDKKIEKQEDDQYIKNLNFKLNEIEYDKELVDRYLNFDLNKVNELFEKVDELYESLAGKSYVSEYDGSEKTYIYGGFGKRLERGYSTAYKSYAFYEEIIAFLEKLEFSNEEYSFINIVVSVLIKNFYYGSDKEFEDVFTLLVKNNVYLYPNKNDLKELSEKYKENEDLYLIKEFISFVTEYRGDEFKSQFNNIKYNLFAYTIDGVSSVYDKGEAEFLKELHVTSKIFIDFIDFYNEKIEYAKVFPDLKNLLNVSLWYYHLTNKEYDFLDPFYIFKSKKYSLFRLLTSYYEAKLVPIDLLYVMGFNKTDIFILGLNEVADEQFNRYNTNFHTNGCAIFKKDIDSIIDSILKIEFKRGTKPTKYSYGLSHIREVSGAKYFIEAINALGKTPFERNIRYSFEPDKIISKKEVFSKIIKGAIPKEDDTQEEFNELVKKYKISDEKLLEVFMYNYNYGDYIEEYLGNHNLFSARMFFYLHSNSYSGESMKATIKRYTPVEMEYLAAGAIDIEWFYKLYEDLGEELFMQFYDNAKYIADGTNHARIKYLIDALLGRLNEEEVIEKIVDKRNKDMILAYSLMPLKEDKDKDIKERYLLLQKFLKESRAFGPQRRESEAMTVKIAIDNLARNAGFSDSQIFEWEMESAILDEVKVFFTEKEVGEYLVYINMEDVNNPTLVISKDGKKLKSLPKAIKKDEYIIEIKEKVESLKDMAKRAKVCFEDAMINSIEFKVEEFLKINQNIVVKETIKNILFISNNQLGFIDGEKLIGLDKEHKLKESDFIRVAHSYDLFEQKIWEKWQDKVLTESIVQPFKQIFRELYVPTQDEKDNDGYTERFAGYQVQGKQALGILKTRGWLISEYEGFEKVFHHNNLRIELYSYADWFTPASIEEPTIEEIKFYNTKTDKAYKIADFSPILFSETMRDIDLVVSVAYVGGVDPLLNHSTIEMRKRILEHNLRLFKIDNYKFEDKHIIINGTFGEYYIHLGSCLTHMKAKGMLPIFPVHSQYDNHIFLPFVDSDPKTAEIVSIALMLAEDNKIKDPTVLMHIK